MKDALIVDAVRSPIGKRNGTLASLAADELAGQVLNALVERNGLDPAEVEDVQLGCVSQVGEQGWNIGRMAPLVAGWPDSVPGTTVDRQCGSSMQCNFNAAAAVWSGSWTLSSRPGSSRCRGCRWARAAATSRRAARALGDRAAGHLGRADRRGVGLSREELDAYSYESHRRALAAIDEGRFEREVVPVEVSNPHVGALFGVDETPRRDTSPESAGGAEAGLPARREGHGRELEPDLRRRRGRAGRERGACSRLGLEPRARFVSFGLAGVDPA